MRENWRLFPDALHRACDVICRSILFRAVLIGTCTTLSSGFFIIVSHWALTQENDEAVAFME